MSATRDKTQKIAFVYENLYQIYRKGKDAALNADLSPSATQAAAPLGLTTSKVLKAGDAAAASATAPVVKNLKDTVSIRPYQPVELIGRRISRKEPESLTGYEPILNKDAEALVSLRKNLDQLNDLHSRLRFMLQELEDLVKKD